MRKKQKIIELAIWTGIWLLSILIATYGPLLLWDATFILTPISIGLTLATGLMMILVNKNLFDTMDELQKKMQLQATAITLILVMVVGLTYSLLDLHNLIQGDAEISLLVMFMGVTYLTSIAIISLRYR
ncbi:MAG: hypothetical protein O2991_02360 [Bacteroidetes bacterium]|nr:hypothetical protein [Bacteroidota bacterium]